jgi:hypothetical protein
MYDVGKHSAASEATDSLEARSEMYGLGFSRHGSQSYLSHRPMLPCHFQKLPTNMPICYRWLDSFAWKQRG